MPAPYFGQCLCGAIRYSVSGEPLTYYACHCTECQRRAGAAFGLSMIVAMESLTLLGGTPGRYEARMPDGRVKAGRLCTVCGTRLWGEARNPDIAVVRPGTLDQPCGLAPVAHLWTRSAQPWFVFPEGVARFDTQPSEPGELGRLWRDAHAEPKTHADESSPLRP